ncbi:hypothetical protein OIU91_05510 [Streptomyces sp. NBC_01456]|uniref:hypothetical protein n=1 Tax=unclassified Streptomyces TaxID=2593676 RepID=UPI002E348C62|nr:MULTISPECIES: hypothetical protein [unclassified Streptomyces]
MPRRAFLPLPPAVADGPKAAVALPAALAATEDATPTVTPTAALAAAVPADGIHS